MKVRLNQLVVLFVAAAVFDTFSCFSQTQKTDVLVIGGTTSGISADAIGKIKRAHADRRRNALVGRNAHCGWGERHRRKSFAAFGNLGANFGKNFAPITGGEGALATGWVSNTQFEPHVGDSIFKAMAKAEKQLSVVLWLSSG